MGGASARLIGKRGALIATGVTLPVIAAATVLHAAMAILPARAAIMTFNDEAS